MAAVNAGAPAPEPTEEIDPRELLALLRRRWALMALVFVLAVGAAAVYTFTTRPMFEASALILLPSAPSGPAELATLLSADLAMVGSRSVQTQAEIVNSPVVTGEALARLTEEQRAAIPEDLTEAIQVRPYRSTDIIEVATVGYSRDAVAAFANALAEDYLQFRDLQNADRFAHTLEYLRRRLQTTQADLLAARQAVRDFKEANRTVDLKAEASALVSDRAGLESQLRALRSQLSGARAELAAATADRVGADGVSVPRERAAASTPVTVLRQRLADLQVRLSEARQEYTEDSPEVRLILAQINEVQTQLGQETTVAMAQSTAPLQAKVASLEAQLAQLEGAAAAADGRLASLPEKEQTYAQLQLDAELALAGYQVLQEQFRKLQIAQESQLSTAQVLKPAEPPKLPFKPRKRMNLLLGVILGAVLALAVGLVADRLDARVRTAHEAALAVGAPVLAQIPELRRGTELRLEASGVPPPLLETFRGLRTTVALRRPEGAVGTLVVASPGPGEGRSLVAANLAVACARDGRRTVLVDADLRGPVQHERFGVAPGPGLAGVLSGRATVAEALQPTAVEGLRLLPAGPLVDNPAELLRADRWASCLAELARDADAVMVDVPPAALYTDAILVASAADGVLIVLSARRADRAATREVVRLLELADADVIGVALNRADGTAAARYPRTWRAPNGMEGPGAPAERARGV